MEKKKNFMPYRDFDVAGEAYIWVVQALVQSLSTLCNLKSTEEGLSRGQIALTFPPLAGDYRLCGRLSSCMETGNATDRLQAGQENLSKPVTSLKAELAR